MVSKIHFIRHGITEGNKKKWFYGASDISLAEEGRENLIKFKNAGVYPELPEHTNCFTTGLQRTEETLRLLYGEIEHKAITKLQEMNFGDYECKSFDELQDDPVFLEWGYDETGDVCLPGAESRNEFNARIEAGLNELLGYHKLKVVELRHKEEEAVSLMVCHGGVISAIMALLFPEEESMETMWDWMPSPGYGYTVTFIDGKVDCWERITDGTEQGKSFESRM